MEIKNKKSFNVLITSLAEELLDEMTTTDGIDGYNTPFAFSGKNSKKKKKRNSTNSTGYKMVKEDISSSDINKIKKLLRSEVAMILKDIWIKKSMWGG